MIRIGVIGGTNASVRMTDVQALSLETPYGNLDVELGSLAEAPGCEIAFVRRHGAGHELLSSSVNHRANTRGLQQAGVSAIIGTTVCGVLDPAMNLAQPIVFDDLFYPENRLPDGTPCTFFDTPGETDRGHYIFDRPFSPSLREAALAAGAAADLSVIDGGTYGYALGPRFNTRAEIAYLRSVGACAVSQTAGPEAVLAGELEIPYCLIGFGVDFANGVAPEPTPVEVLDSNIALSSPAFSAIISGIANTWTPGAFDTGFVYRFDER